MRSMSPLSYEPFSGLLVMVCTRATLLRKCWAMFANPLVVRNTRFVLQLILGYVYTIPTSYKSYNYPRKVTSAT